VSKRRLLSFNSCHFALLLASGVSLVIGVLTATDQKRTLDFLTKHQQTLKRPHNTPLHGAILNNEAIKNIIKERKGDEK